MKKFFLLVATLLVVDSFPASADWTAYNDQGQTGNSYDTALTISTLGTASGNLKDSASGVSVTPILTISTSGSGTASAGAGTMGSPSAGTPAALIFGSYIDWVNGSNPGIHLYPGITITYAFSGLDPNKRYRFAGTAIRGGSSSYGNRWTQAELVGAQSFKAAHTANVLTALQYPASLTGNQVAWNSGINTSGDVVEWDDIAPSSSGTFSIRITKYSGSISGNATASSSYAYALQAIRLDEITITGPYVSLASPSNNSTILLPTNMLLNALVSGFSGNVTNVSFYNNATKLGESLSSPFSFNWAPDSIGAATLTAIAQDSTGITRTSAPIYIVIKENFPPTVSISNPINGTVLTVGDNLKIEVLASDVDGSVQKVQFLENGTLIGESTNSPYACAWASVPAGTFNLSAIAYDNSGASRTSSVVQIFVIQSTAPSIDSFVPEPGVVHEFGQLTVKFSTPVLGVSASALYVNGIAATNVTGSNDTYIFSFPRPSEGALHVSWLPNHNIVDLETPPKAFGGTKTNEMADYTFVDTIVPTVKSVTPLPGASVHSLKTIDVTFSEPVTGVKPTDLLVNGVTATKVTGALEGPYQFTFSETSEGGASVTWAATQTIHDLANSPNSFQGTSWQYVIDSLDAETNVVISEIMFHPVSEQSSDQYIELHNAGTKTVNLYGWHFSKGISYTFPQVQLLPDAYLVIANNVSVFQSNHPAVTNVIGGWEGWMSSHLTLKNAMDKTINDVKFGTSGDWGIRERGATREKVVSITRSGSTATVTMPGNYTTGDTFTISGADQPEYNGTFTMTTVSAAAPDPCVSFTYTVSGSPATPATGTIVCHQISDCGHIGWEWTSSADGLGSSLELLNASLPNQYGQNWGFSSIGGTPGQVNSRGTNNLAPMILNVQHYPVVPASTNPVTITTTLLDEKALGLAATLYWRIDASPTNKFTSVSMLDDGLHGDGLANDGVWGAVIPAQANSAVVEFFIQATDAEGNTRTWPAPAIETNGAPVQTANALYQVDDSFMAETSSQPMFRLILRSDDYAELVSFPSASPWSNCRLNLTVISVDGVDTQTRYLCSVRDRGAGTRQKKPCNHEIDFPDDQPWHGVGSINLNTQFTESQYMGYVLAMLSGLDTEASRIVQVRINNLNRANAGSPQFGSYIQLERTDNNYVKNHWPTEEGNIYRGQSFTHSCNLAYHGPGSTWLDYAADGYTKQNHSQENDWNDLINLCRVLSITNVSDAVYEQNVRSVVDVEQWMRYFAVFNFTASMETAFATGVGDDYSLYRRSRDNRWILMAHDWDTILGEGDTTGQTNMPLFVMCPSVTFSTFSRDTYVLDRFMKHPSFAPIYYSELKRLCDSIFFPANLNSTLDQSLGRWVPTSTINNMKKFNAFRQSYIVSQIPTNLTVSISLTKSNSYLRTTNPSLVLTGQADAIQTRSVTVNGLSSTWSAWEARWTNTYSLTPGLNHLVVESCNSNGVTFASTNLDVWYDAGTSTSVGGTISSDTTWTLEKSPYAINSTLTVPYGVTLTIQPGVTVYLSSGVNVVVADGGRILAEGNANAPIYFASSPNGSTTWGGITINGSVGSPETHLSHAFFQGNGNTCIEVKGGTLWLDHAVFLTTTHQYVSLDGSSFLLDDCYFPTSSASFELLHGTDGIKSGGHGIVRRCFFGSTTGYNDIMDFTGGNRDLNQPIIQYYNNVFIGASDDILDLDGTDAWIEGNIFLHSHRNGSPDSSSAISGGNYDFGTSDGGLRTSEITVIGNIFYDCDDVATAKEGNFFTFQNNTIVHITKDGGQDFASGVLNERDTTPSVTGIGKGFYLEGNIIWDVEQLVRNFDSTNTTVTFTNNLLSVAWTGLGGGNTVADPLLTYIPQVSETTNFQTWDQVQIFRKWFTLQPNSPAVASGPNGRDKGGLIPFGVSISGEPAGVTRSNVATLTIGSLMKGNGIPTDGFPNGSGFISYKWQLDKSSWSAGNSTLSPLVLSNLSSGPHVVTVIGKNDAGYYQNDTLLGDEAIETQSKIWIVDQDKPSIRLNKILAKNVQAYEVNGNHPDLIELYNDGGSTQSLAGMSITDDSTVPQKYVFDSNTIMSPGEYLILCADKLTTNVGIHLGFNLAQEGGSVLLFAPNGRLIDSVTYGPQIPDYSIGRLKDGSWGLTQPTFGLANVAVTVGDVHQVKINEWLASSVNPSAFLELYNSDSRPVCLGGTYLTDNWIGAPTMNLIPTLSFIAGNGFVEFIPDGNSEGGASHLNFTLSPDRGEIALADAGLTLIDRILYGPQTNAVSQGRSPSGSTNIVSFTTSTPGSANPLPKTPEGQLVLNEIVSKNFTGLTNWDGSTPDWIELYNPTTNTLSLTDMSLSDDPANPRKWVFPSGVTIAASGYVVVICDENSIKSTTNSALMNSGFSIKQNGGTIYLYDTTSNGSALLDGISYGVQAADLSLGRVPSGGTNWTLNLPTPGSANIAASLGDPTQLKINEWMANPSSGSKWFEIYNPNAQPVILSGLSLRDDVHQNTIIPLSFIGSGLNGYTRFWLDKNPDAGPDHLSFGVKASGGTLGVFTASGTQIDTITFGPQTVDVSQGRLPDGSVNIVNFPTTASPSESNYLPLPDIVINEVLSAPSDNPPKEQAIELLNTGTTSVDISGWYLSNMKYDLVEFRIPSNTILSPGEYHVFYGTDFNFEPDGQPMVWLDAVKGDTLYLSAANADGTLNGYRTSVQFDATSPGLSYGRYTNSVGKVEFIPLSQTTFGVDNPTSLSEFRQGTGAANAAPSVGPIILNEIMFDPLPGSGTNDNIQNEYVELLNITSNSVSLFDPLAPSNTWKITGGITYTFPTNTIIFQGGLVLLVSFDPQTNSEALAEFRTRYNIDTNTALFGPFSGHLANSGESIALYKPIQPQPQPIASGDSIPYVLVEHIDYSNATPWPLGANATGKSLQRLTSGSFGDDPANWFVAAQTAGQPNVSTNSDLNGDGLPDAWQIQYFSSIDNPDAAPNVDPDHDGLTNLQEYLAGTDPTDSNSSLNLAINASDDGSIYIQFNAVIGKTYTIWFCNTLNQDSWTKLINIPAQTNNSPIQITAPSIGVQTRFYRLSIP